MVCLEIALGGPLSVFLGHVRITNILMIRKVIMSRPYVTIIICMTETGLCWNKSYKQKDLLSRL